MRGISEDELIEVRKSLAAEGLNTDTIDALITLKVKELQEPWMTLEEFLKSGFTGLCWVYTNTEFVYTAYCAEDGQFYESDFTECRLDKNTIVKVVPLYKPEPPR